ncbi:hypothetical protein [Constantimarinum furrinae]|uniref:Uncharacterized protein n=1 Tax=Constantimarinum furrinae TaxID=2562285 RepID=A0A7G8PTN6_9FLAO|nr:hypothetical protein [Constantimarinum furrinae]QNJ97702.1 hypothetical protein ALE3EI_1131 [Constantimarinum furrinae]
MKVAIYIFIAIAIGLIIFNSFKLNFDDLLEGDSAIAVISIVAAACVILLMLILKASRKIAGKK